MTRGDFDVIFAGGGLVGLSGALALAHAGLLVAVVDAEAPGTAQAPEHDGRASAVAYANFRMLRRLGVAGRIGEVQPIAQILVSDGRPPDRLRRGGPGPALLHFDPRELSGGEDGEPLGYMVENRRMRSALLETVAATPAVTLLAPARVEDVRLGPGAGVVRLADGTELSAPLVVGAEGRDSRAASAIGARTIGWDYRQTGLVATLACERSHEGVAHEYFLPSGPFAILPLTESRVSLVWTERPRAAEAVIALGPEIFHAEARRRIGDLLGRTRLAGPAFSYPLGLAVSDRYVAPRAALVGDAARRIHPIAGQGFNLGLKDVAALADVVGEAAGLGLDPGGLDALRRYEQWRRPDSVMLAAATDAFDRLFSTDLAPVRWARDLGMAAVDRVPAARRLFMRDAGADLGELPSLLRA